MSDKRKYLKILTQERKEKLGINQQNRFQTSGRGSRDGFRVIQVSRDD